MKMLRNSALLVVLWIAGCLLLTLPCAHAQDSYALEIGAGMTATVNDDPDALRLGSYTYEFWLKDLDGFTGSWRRVMVKGAGAVNTGRGPNVGLFPSEPALQYAHSTGSGQSALRTSGEIPANEWIHVSLVLTGVDGEQMIFLNGVQDAVGTASGLSQDTQEPVLTIGNAAHVILDDLRVWDYARTDIEIQGSMNQELLGSEAGLAGYWTFNEGQGDTAFDSSPSANHAIVAGALWTTDTAQLAPALPPGPAHNPAIADGAVDVPREVMLGWQAGPFAATHDVYLGTASDDVSNADPTNPLDVLVSQGQTETSYDAGVLDFGQTYYWRVDEVNGPPDNSVYTGDVWSFEVEPLSIPVANILATASSAHDADMTQEKTIDGSGLNDLDQHSNEPKDMWLSGMGDPTPSIQYEFDQAYKLHELWVWNSNQSIESFVGLGAKDVVMEVSLDGTEWTIVEGTPPFAQAPGQLGYAHNTTIDLRGALAKFVRLTITSGHGMLPQYGLSEVRFLYIPTFAREPKPADGSDTDSADVVLSWRAGREAALHEVYLGTDPNALALADTVTDNSYRIADLDYASTYYWQILEVNDAENPTSYASDIWSFSTAPYAVVDDFDQYNNDCQRIFFAWTDGLGHNGGTDIDDCDVPPSNGNGGGSIVGNDVSPFAERTIVNAGSVQSMPFNYDNAFGTSEATLALASQDWTAHGIKSLSLYFRGDPANTGQLYVKINTTKIVYEGLTDALQREQWLPWNIDLSTVAGNLQSVTRIAIGVDGASASGMLYIDDIRLYPLSPEIVTPVDPDPANLVAHYAFEGNANDSVGGLHGTLVGNADFAPGPQGQALSINTVTITDYVEIVGYQGILGASPVTVSAWVNTDSDATGTIVGWGPNVAGQRFCFRINAGRLRTEHEGGNVQGDTAINDGNWHHVALTIEANATISYPEVKLWVDGQDDSRPTTDPDAFNLTAGPDVRIGSRPSVDDRYFIGLIDEVYIYDRVLSPAEIAWLAGMTQPFDMPFAAE
jgi:hypothetical protein